MAGLRHQRDRDPHRMGAALTYARRYALFTLVGIAGEDDLDAPDLMTPTDRTLGPERPKATDNGRLNHGHTGSLRRARDAKPAKPMLGPEASAQLRNKLLAELSDLGSGDEMAGWAHRSLGEKNKLTAPDAQCVEDAFQAKIATAPVSTADVSQGGQARSMALPEISPAVAKLRSRPRSKVVDKSELTFPEPRRIRDRDHVRFVAKRPCLICGRQPSDAHHLRFAQSRALGRKVSDEFTVPLCRGHHREVHRSGDEAAWWRKLRIDPTTVARALWLERYPIRTAQDESRSRARRRFGSVRTGVVGKRPINARITKQIQGCNHIAPAD